MMTNKERIKKEIQEFNKYWEFRNNLREICIPLIVIFLLILAKIV